MDRKSGRIETIGGKSQVDKDLLSVDKLLSDHAGNSKHGKASILKLLGVEFQELSWVFRGQTKRVETNITREVVLLQNTVRSKDITRVGPSLKSTVELKGTDDDGEEFEKGWGDSADFIQVTDGRSNVLVSGLEERVELNGFLGDEHTDGSQHGNTSVLELGLTVLLDGFVVVVGGVTKRVERWDRVEGSRKSVTASSNGDIKTCGEEWREKAEMTDYTLNSGFAKDRFDKRPKTYAKALLSGVNLGATEVPKAAAEAKRDAAMMSFMFKMVGGKFVKIAFKLLASKFYEDD